MRGDDLLPLLVPGRRGQALEVHKGVLDAYDSGTGENTVSVAGGTLENLPRLDTGVTLTAGDVVVLIRLRSSWAILGRIVAPSP